MNISTCWQVKPHLLGKKTYVRKEAVWRRFTSALVQPGHLPSTPGRPTALCFGPSSAFAPGLQKTRATATDVAHSNKQELPTKKEVECVRLQSLVLMHSSPSIRFPSIIGNAKIGFSNLEARRKKQILPWYFPKRSKILITDPEIWV